MVMQAAAIDQADSPLPNGALKPGACSAELASFVTRLSSQYYLSDYNRAKQQNHHVQAQAAAPPPPGKPHASPQAASLQSSPLRPLKKPVPQWSSSASASSQQPSSPSLTTTMSNENNASAALHNNQASRPASPRKDSLDAPMDTDEPSAPDGRTSPIRAPLSNYQKPQPSSKSSSAASPLIAVVKQALSLAPEPDSANQQQQSRPPVARSVSAPAPQRDQDVNDNSPSAAPLQAVPSHLIKTSITHPLHISPLVPLPDLTSYHSAIFAACSAPATPASLPDQAFFDRPLWFVKSTPAGSASPSILPSTPPLAQRIGNVLLSSCPGKKVRLTLPIPANQSNRSSISRDVYLDLERAATSPDFSARAVICCLDDVELAALGAPWPEYAAAASRLGLTVFRLPVSEGFAPDSVELLDDLLSQVILNFTLKGANVLCHCRGGVGRAGLVGVVWWLKMGFAGDLSTTPPAVMLEKCIRWIRMRRSTKAIETPIQVLYLHDFITRLSQNGRPVSASGLLSPASA